MSNYFDKYDSPKKNYFDKFDKSATAVTSKSTRPEQDYGKYVRPVLGSKKLGAVLTGLGYSVGDTVKGIRQITNDWPVVGRLTDDKDIARWKEDARLMGELRKSPTVGGSALLGEVAGYVADPVSLAVPMAKAKSIGKMAKLGAGYGAGLGAVGYVDPNLKSIIGEGKQSRLENTLLGAAGGGLLMPAIGGATNLARAGRNVGRKMRGKKPLDLIPMKEYADAEALRKAGVIKDDPSPQKPLALPPARKEPFAVTPKGTVATEKQFTDMGLTPDVRKIQEKFPPVETLKPSKKIATDKTTGVKLSSNPMSDPEAVKGSIKGMKSFYTRYAEPFYRNVVAKNPISSGGGVVGSVAGWMNADENDTSWEKAGKAVMGGLLGVGGVKGLAWVGSKIPSKDYGDWTNYMTKKFIDREGQEKPYVDMKDAMAYTKAKLRVQTLDLSGKVANELTPKDRKILNGILQGEATTTNKDLLSLNREARRTIKEWGQMMVDVGMLDVDTFKKGAETYLHRSYTKHMTGNVPEWAKKGGKIIRMIGNSLKPRGVMDDVPLSKVEQRLQEGWEKFGKIRNGKQRMRRQLTKEERKARGEIEDAAFNIAETGRLMANDIPTYKFYDDLSKSKYASDTEVAGWVQVPTGTIPKTNKKQWGNLGGKWVRDDIWNDISSMEYYRQLKENDWVKTYRAMNSWWKMTKTALNPTVHVNNIAANVALYDLSDADWKYIGRSMNHLMQGRESPIYKQAMDLGVFEADFASQELRRNQSEWLKAHESIPSIAPSDPVSAALNVAKTTWRLTGGNMADLYQKEDHLFRLALFEDRLNKGFSPEEAAKAARKQFIDYNIEASGINALRETALPFLAFTYRAVPILAEAAVTKPWKFAKWGVALAGLNAAGEKWSKGNTEAERALMSEQKKGRMFGMPFMPHTAVKLPTHLPDAAQKFINKKAPSIGKRLPQNIGPRMRNALGIGDMPQYLDVTRWIPGGDVADVSSRQKSMIPYLPSPLQPSFGAAGSLVFGGAGFNRFKGEVDRRIGASPRDDLKVRAEMIGQDFLPNFPGVQGAYSTKKIKNAIQGIETATGDTLPVWQAVAQSLGFKIFPADLEKSSMREQFAARNRINALREYVERARIDYDRAKQAYNNGVISKEKLDKARKTYEEIERKRTAQAEKVLKRLFGALELMDRSGR